MSKKGATADIVLLMLFGASIGGNLLNAASGYGTESSLLMVAISLYIAINGPARRIAEALQPKEPTQ